MKPELERIVRLLKQDIGQYGPLRGELIETCVLCKENLNQLVVALLQPELNTPAGLKQVAIIRSNMIKLMFDLNELAKEIIK